MFSWYGLCTVFQNGHPLIRSFGPMLHNSVSSQFLPNEFTVRSLLDSSIIPINPPTAYCCWRTRLLRDPYGSRSKLPSISPENCTSPSITLLHTIHYILLHPEVDTLVVQIPFHLRNHLHTLLPNNLNFLRLCWYEASTAVWM